VPPSFWPKANRFRVALRQGGPPPVAMWITLQSANVVEMVGAHGVDTVILDLEHTASSPGDLQPMVVAAQLAGMTALVRPAGADRHEIGRLLDAGADGIVFPMVSSAGEAAAAARSDPLAALSVQVAKALSPDASPVDRARLIAMAFAASQGDLETFWAARRQRKAVPGPIKQASLRKG